MPTTTYKVKENKLTGKRRVYFPCPVCGVEMHCPLEQAGKPDRCPECAAAVKVPGEAEWRTEQLRLEAQREKDEAAKREADARRAAAERAELARQVNEARETAAAQKRAAELAQLAPDTFGYSAMAVLCFVLGIIALLIAVVMDTTVGDVHNIGLLNTRLCLTVAGVVLFATSGVVHGCVAIVWEVNRWGRHLAPKPPEAPDPIALGADTEAL